MEDSEKKDTERSLEPVEGEKEEAGKDSGEAVEAKPYIESVVKSSEEGFNEKTRSMVESVAQSSLVKEVAELIHVSDPWASLKNLGHVSEEDKAPGSMSKETEDCALPTSDETVVASRESGTVELDENSRATHTQPFVAFSAGERASWANCCGLLDVFKRSDQ